MGCGGGGCIVPGDYFLHTTHLAIGRLCDMIACRRVEMLLARTSRFVADRGYSIPQNYLLHFWPRCSQSVERPFGVVKSATIKCENFSKLTSAKNCR